MQPVVMGAEGRRGENLSLAFQELIVVGERLRSNRQAVSDANSFRLQLREGLKRADAEARQQGYVADDIQLAIFAVVAFLDESILNLRSPIFSDWPRRPLQEEMFGHHIAGEVFFQNLQKLMGRNDSHDTADLLEVYQICLLLGFAGRYSMGGRGELGNIISAVGDKIRRIRKPSAELSPNWQLPQENFTITPTGDPLVKWFMIGAIACLLLMIGTFVIAKLDLGSSLASLQTMSRQNRF